MFFNAFLNFFKRKDHKSSRKERHHHHNKVQRNSTLSDTTDAKSNLTSQTSTQPISSLSEGRNFHFIDGRRFNSENDVKYLLPNDNDEADRLHQQHWIIRYVFQRNYHAPIHKLLEKGISVLDAGCGPATWTFDMAENYPNSQFTGIDVSFVFPEAIRPPNVDFHISNVSKDLPFPDNSFDYFHQRLLVFALTREHWVAALQNAYRVIKPGGYIEMVETTANCFNMGPIMTKMQKVLVDLMVMRDMLPDVGKLLESLLQDAGFVNIHTKQKHIPVNHTDKVGELWWKDLKHGYGNIRPMLILGNPAFEDLEYYQNCLQQIENECAQVKTDFIFYIAYGQKPLEE